MRSQLRFCMHPDDERAFAAEVYGEPGVVVMCSERPIQSLDQVTDFSSLLIWHPGEAPGLQRRLVESPKGDFWTTDNEFVGIQWIRSCIQDNVLLVGRISIGTTGVGDDEFAQHVAPTIERRYERLRGLLRRTYRSGVIRWRGIDQPPSAAEVDRTLWVGPHALDWLGQQGNVVRQELTSRAFGELMT